MTYMKYCLFLLCCLGYLQGSEDDFKLPIHRYSPAVSWMMGKLASSSSLQQYARKKKAQYRHQESNSIHADLFKKAQEEIGIPQEAILPVFDISVQDCPQALELHGFAVTAENKIEIITENFNHLPYGCKRIIALHESFHNKYHDNFFTKWCIEKITLAAVISTGLSMVGLLRLNYKHVSCKPLRIAGYVGSPLIAIATNMLVSGLCMHKLGFLRQPLNSYDCFKEWRADSDAVKHARCYQCVQEFAQVASRETSVYLSEREVLAYASQFKRENKVCQVHASDGTDSVH